MNPEVIFSRLNSLRILVIGDIMLDHYVWGEVSRISPEAPVPVVHVVRESDTAGGAANVALNLASLGVQAELIGCLGQDLPATRLRKLLESHSVSTSRCVVHPEVSTIVKTRVVARTQQLCRIDHEAPRSAYNLMAESFRSELSRAVAQSDAIIISDYAKGVVTQKLVDEVLELGRTHGRLVAVDPKPARKLDLKGVGLMTPNRGEAWQLAGLNEQTELPDSLALEEVARLIHEKYAPQLLVITLGADGMAICSNGRVEHRMPTRAREVFDVSGAGDTVIATVVAALAAKASPVDAAHLANLAAGIVVSKFGTATVTPSEVLAFAKAGDGS